MPKSTFEGHAFEKTLGMKGFHKTQTKERLAASLVRPDSKPTPLLVCLMWAQRTGFPFGIPRVLHDEGRFA